MDEPNLVYKQVLFDVSVTDASDSPVPEVVSCYFVCKVVHQYKSGRYTFLFLKNS